MAAGQNRFGIPFWGPGAPPILEPILVGIGMLGVRDFDPWPCGLSDRRTARELVFSIRVSFETNSKKGILYKRRGKVFLGSKSIHKILMPAGSACPRKAA